MRKSMFKNSAILATVFAFTLTGCVNSNKETQQTITPAERETVQITDIHGTVTVPVNPQKVVALDNRTFETLADWGVELAAVPMYDVFGWKSALEVGGASADHKGDDISVEAIAQSDPDWIFVLDRDAAVSSVANAVPAQDVINRSPALQNTTAVTQEHIVYAPNDTYTNESIQTYLELFEDIADALGGQ